MYTDVRGGQGTGQLLVQLSPDRNLFDFRENEPFYGWTRRGDFRESNGVYRDKDLPYSREISIYDGKKLLGSYKGQRVGLRGQFSYGTFHVFEIATDAFILEFPRSDNPFDF